MNTAPALLGIDLGTSGLKVALFDAEGRCRGRAYRPSEYLPGPEGVKEQMPQAWWRNLCHALREVLASAAVPPRQIAGVGICGFHHCPVFLKPNGEPARPVILLHDERLVSSRQDLERTGILFEIEARTRSMVSAGHFPPIYHYVRTHDPAALASTRWILSAKDYLRFRLTGAIGAEICDATGTNLVEPGENAWSDALCELLSVAPSLLPPIGTPWGIAGQVTREAAAQSGLSEGTPVVYGGGDSHCALLGLGCIGPGHTGMILGTNSTLRTVFAGFVSHPQIKVWVQRHVVPDHYTASASSMAGASVLTWAKQVFCLEETAQDDEICQRLEQEAAAVSAGAGGLIFLPYIHGERSPFYDPQATGAFIGIRREHQRAHFLRAVLEGVALNVANCHELLRECAATSAVTLQPPRLAGAGGKLALWRQIIADCLGQPVHLMDVGEAGALGAAMLAGVGVAVYPKLPAAVAATVRQKSVIEPDAAKHELYVGFRRKLNDCYRRVA